MFCFLNKKKIFSWKIQEEKKNPGSIPGRKKNPGSIPGRKKIQNHFRKEKKSRKESKHWLKGHPRNSYVKSKNFSYLKIERGRLFY